MVSVMRHELVFKRRWIEEEDFLAEMSMATLVPGVIAVNVAFLQGRRMRGWRGALIAVLGTVLPSVCVILMVVWVALPFFAHPGVAAFLRGCALAVAGQLAFTSYLFARKYLMSLANVALCAVSFLMIVLLKLHPIWAVITAAGIGYFCAQLSAANDDSSESTLN